MIYAKTTFLGNIKHIQGIYNGKYKKLKKLQKESIWRYSCMIEWADKQDEDSPIDQFKMFNSLGMSWEDDECPYCLHYYEGHRGTDCKECPINSCCSSEIYGRLLSSETWGEWIENAKKVREYIRING